MEGPCAIPFAPADSRMTSRPLPRPDAVPMRALRRSPARRDADRQLRLVLLFACLGCALTFVVARMIDPRSGDVMLVASALGFLLSAQVAQRLVQPPQRRTPLRPARR